MADSLDFDVDDYGEGLELRLGPAVDRLQRRENTAATNADVFVFVNEGTDHGTYAIEANPFARRALNAGRD